MLCFMYLSVWKKWGAVLLITHMMDFRWCHGFTEHKDSGLSVTTAKISTLYETALSPWALQGAWFQRQGIQVTHTHCVGTNQIQTGRCLVTASSRAIALHDNSSPYSIPARIFFLVLLTVRLPLTAGRFVPSGIWGRAAAGRFLQLIPLTSFFPDRASGLLCQFGIPLSGKKNPLWLQELKSPTEINGWWS